MSLSLLKRSLQIVEEDLPGEKKKKKNKTKTSGKESILNLIPQNQRLKATSHEKGKKFEIEAIAQTEKFTLKDAKRAIEESSNRSQRNLDKLLRLSSRPVDTETIEQVVKHAHKGRDLKAEKDDQTKDNETSVFTAEDFEAFEKEYFSNENI
uniref:Uncharacterized protein n=1 Tax=Tabanus bromius TaxID=304241 RepID=A0A0K8TRU5_TABBR